jgi:hypothetical protein
MSVRGKKELPPLTKEEALKLATKLLREAEVKNLSPVDIRDGWLIANALRKKDNVRLVDFWRSHFLRIELWAWAKKVADSRLVFHDP